MINVAKLALLAVLALPILELAVFIAVAAIVGFGWALSLVLAGSLTVCVSCATSAVLIITRMRVVLDQGSLTALQADNRGGQVIFAGILLLVPGFINDIVALILLIAPLRWALSAFGGASRLPAMVVCSISRPNNGIRYPIPYYPTGAKTNAIAERTRS